MPRHCVVCGLPKRVEIETSVLSGSSSIRSSAKAAGISWSCLQRHMQHLPAAVAKTAKAKARETADSGRLLDRIEQLLAEAGTIVAAAKKRKEFMQALAGIRESRYLLELIGRINGELRNVPRIGEGELVPGTVGAAAAASVTVNLSPNAKVKDPARFVALLRQIYNLPPQGKARVPDETVN